MFVNVSVELPQRQNVLAIPTTAVLSAPYGDAVYLVKYLSGTMALINKEFGFNKVYVMNQDVAWARATARKPANRLVTMAGICMRRLSHQV